MNKTLELPPLALYVHIPWCSKKCPYCDFNSHISAVGLPEQQYIAALLQELDTVLPLLGARPLSSIFIGGGTPSLFTASSIDTLLQGIHHRFSCVHDIEITLEANPGTLEQGRFAGFRAAGVNRLSIGVQSFANKSLQALGRIHDAAAAKAAVRSAQDAGLPRLNLDLMYGLPGQTLAQAQQDIQQALDLAPGHISYYQLTLEPDTAFYRRPPSLPPDEHIWQMQCQAEQLLTAAGYQQYEVSAYAQPGQQCRHNLNYWQFGDYIGIGAGAHQKLTLSDGTVQRCQRPRLPEVYQQAVLRGDSAEGVTEPGAADLIFEFMLNALRLTEGFNIELFELRTGLPIATIEPILQDAVKQGFLTYSNRYIMPTTQGRRFLNELLLKFLS